MQATGIEWTDLSWNPVRGCTKISPGCKHCYAMGMAARFSGPGLWGEGYAEMAPGGPRWTGRVELVPEKLSEPKRWRKPRRVFVNSTSDLWHEYLELGAVRRVYEAMWECPQHTFQVLTKRPERRWNAFTLWDREPAPHIWEGTSIESAEYLGRLEELRSTPAAVRFLSCEPLLGSLGALDLAGIHWVIVGGESGPQARPMHPDWAREIRDQCIEQGVAFWFKQWGAWAPFQDNGPLPPRCSYIGIDGSILPGDAENVSVDACMGVVGKKAAGAELDGQEWRQMPREGNKS